MKYTHEFVSAPLLAADAYAAAATYGVVNTYLDCQGYDQAVAVIIPGVAAANAESLITVQESDSTTAASFANITNAAFTQITPTAVSHTVQLGYINLRPRKRYLRLKSVGDGSNAVEVAGTILAYGARVKPMGQPSSITASIWAVGCSATFRV